MSGSPFPSRSFWREGKHLQTEVGPIAAWFGVAVDRLMVGIIVNYEARCIGFGIGPFYFGIGASYDR